MKIRLATLEDVDLVFKWVNDPLVRAVSFNSDEIPYNDHKKWFYNKIEDKTSIYHIIEFNKEAIGQVRYDLNNHNYIISILLASEFRGKGLSATMLKTSLDEFFKTNKKNIFAYIKKKNAPSVKLFLKCGFKKTEDLILSNEDSIKLCYSYEDWKLHH